MMEIVNNYVHSVNKNVSKRDIERFYEVLNEFDLEISKIANEEKK
mgnify:CR=1 FL=1